MFLIAIIFCGGVFCFFPFQNCHLVKAEEEYSITTLEQLQNASISEIASLSEYDGRQFGIVTNVKDQGDSNLCWAYSVINASETSILRSGIDASVNSSTLSLSPEQLAYRTHNRGADPLGNSSGEYTGKNWYSSAGNSSYGGVVFSQWCGPVLSNQSANCDPYQNCAYRLVKAENIDTLYMTADYRISQIKKAVAQYGAVTFGYNNLQNQFYYNPKNETSTQSSPHACTIIGWNDNISADKFVPNGASRNGGWLVKNSYSDLPYFYISYDNSSSNMYAFEYCLASEYENNYFYDSVNESGVSSLVSITNAGVIFQAQKGENGKDEFVKAVNVETYGLDVDCEVSLFANITDLSNPTSGTLVGSGSAKFERSGYHTINLDQLAKVSKDSYFAVVVNVSSQTSSPYICMASQQGIRSFANRGNGFNSINYALRIKAFTVTYESEEKEKIDISSSLIVFEDTEFVYTGQEIQPRFNVVCGEKTLVEKNDFSYLYKNNVFAGTGEIIIAGKGDYQGEKTFYFTIQKAILQNLPTLQMSADLKTTKTLGQISLPSLWKWENENITLVKGKMRATAIYMGSDKDNYENTSCEILINVSESNTTENPENPDDNQNTDSSGNSTTDKNKAVKIVCYSFAGVGGIIFVVAIIFLLKH